MARRTFASVPLFVSLPTHSAMIRAPGQRGKVRAVLNATPLSECIAAVDHQADNKDDGGQRAREENDYLT